MEEIYMKGFLGSREWCSEKVDFEPYFESFSELLEVITPKKSTEIDIFQRLVPQSNQLSGEELAEVAHFTRGELLTQLCEKDIATKAPSAKDNQVENAIFNLLSKRKNRLDDGRQPYTRKEVKVNTAQQTGYKDLSVKKDFVVTFRIHEPFTHKIGEQGRPGRCSQQISVLGKQNLSQLRHMILCVSDYQDVRGDVSQVPDSPIRKIAKEEYPSSMFYFDNTFYVDTQIPNMVDYSKELRKWGTNRGIKFDATKPMGSTHVRDLNVRLGYPYLFLHQGCCEHLIIISDARLLTANDSLYSMDYPLIEKVSNCQISYCMICGHFPANWIVRQCERLVHDPSYLCKSCFKQFNYINGKKVGKFKAYRFCQKSSIQ